MLTGISPRQLRIFWHYSNKVEYIKWYIMKHFLL